jgi:hypothetical protein
VTAAINTAKPCARAVVSDDGTVICLMAYAGGGAALPVPLSPLRAVWLADELLRAALPKLGSEMQPGPRSALEGQPVRRGGDAHSAKRRRRDEAIRAVAPLIADGESTERRARKIARQLATFRPTPEETTPGNCPRRGRQMPRKPNHA